MRSWIGWAWSVRSISAPANYLSPLQSLKLLGSPALHVPGITELASTILQHVGAPRIA